MFKFNKNFDYDYRSLNSTDTDGGRFYYSAETDNWYPSVTTVTGYEKQKFFEEWRKKPENQRVLTHSLRRGNVLHETIENYLKNDSDYDKDLSLPDKRIFLQVKHHLDKIDNIMALEIPLYSDVLKMAGRADCVAEYDGKLSIIDFKGSNKEKNESWISNYFQQATAYAIMWHERTKIPIDQIVILVSSDDGTDQEFVKCPVDYVPSLYETIKNYFTKSNYTDIVRELKA